MTQTLDGVELEPIPRAIEAVRVEEPTWRARHLAEMAYEVGRQAMSGGEDAYYMRTTEGTDLAALERLELERKIFISQREALALREEHDFQWQFRPKLYDRLVNLWRGGRLELSKNGSVGNIFTADEDPDSMSPVYSLAVSADGGATIEIDRPALSDENIPVVWHEYNLPRGTSDCIRRLRRANQKGIDEKIARNGDVIVRYFRANLEEFTELAAKIDS